jgi:hypothetical protein
MPILQLTRFSALRCSGPDASQFLHGQLTCDVAALQPGTSTYGGYCTPKGRLLATFILIADAESFLLILPSSIASSIHKRLSMYILRAKVVLKDLSLSHACIGVYGPDATTHLDTYHLALPDLPNTVSQQDSVWITHLHPNRYFVVAPQTTPADHLAGAEDAWNLLDIEAGIPWITPEIQDEFTPQMVNLDLIGALSFTKGCYPGQEIVARTHYLGKLKQRMYHGEVNSMPQTGDPLYCAHFGDQISGRIITSARNQQGSAELLAVLHTDVINQHSYHLGSNQGPIITNIHEPKRPNTP